MNFHKASFVLNYPLTPNDGGINSETR
jgi:hypothetical protein